MKQAVDSVQWRLRGGGIQGSIQRAKAVRGMRQCKAHVLYRKQIMSEEKLYRYSEGTGQRTDTCKAQNTGAVEGRIEL